MRVISATFGLVDGFGRSKVGASLCSPCPFVTSLVCSILSPDITYTTTPIVVQSPTPSSSHSASTTFDDQPTSPLLRWVHVYQFPTKPPKSGLQRSTDRLRKTRESSEKSVKSFSSVSIQTPEVHGSRPSYCLCPPPGSGESGKSTIVKQMKIIHQNGYTESELRSFRPTIFRNLVDSAQDIVLAMRKLAVDPDLPENRLNAEKIMDYRVDALLGAPQVASGALLGPSLNSTPPSRTLDRRDRDLAYAQVGTTGAMPKVFLDPEIAQAIHALWADPIIPKLMDHSSDFYLMDSAS